MSQHRPDHEPDPAFEAVRAADPAAHLSPDTAALDAAVRSRLGAPGDELAAARTARATRGPRRWLAVAAVAAGTLAVGSAGYALGDRADADLTATGPGAGASQAVPPAGTEAGVLGGTAGATAPGAAADARVAPESMSSLPWYGGRTVFTGQGLSEAEGTAEVWAYDPTAVFGEGTAARLAASLGLDGEPRLEGGMWAVGPLDGTGPTLQLQPDGVASVSYYDPTRDPYGCVAPVPEGGVASDGGGDASVAVPAPDVPACTATDLGDAPQGDAAVARARELVTSAGADPDAYEYEVQESGTPTAVYVVAHELIGGQRTGLLWNITLVEDGVQSVYGALAPLVPLGTYAVVSPADAVARLTDPRFGPTLGGPVLADDTAVSAPGAAVIEPGPGGTEPAGPRADGRPPAAVQPGATFTWPVLEVTLTEAQLGLTQHTEPDGATVLLPAYQLSGDDGAVWSVLALTDEGLDFSVP